MGTPNLTNDPMPRFLPASPLRQSHLFSSSCAPRCQTGMCFCISRQGTPHHMPITPATCQPRYQLRPPLASQFHTHTPTPRMQRKHTRADLRAHVPSATGRDGEHRMMPSTARCFPSFYKLFPPAGPGGEVSFRQASEHQTWARLARQHCSANSTGPSLAIEIVGDGKASCDLCNSSV